MLEIIITAILLAFIIGIATGYLIKISKNLNKK